MWRRAILPIILIATAAYLQCTPAQPPSVEQVRPRPPAGVATAIADAPGSLEELKQRISVILEHEQIAGAAFALIGRDGPIWVGGLGVRDRATGAPVDGDTAFRVGSLSKSVVALGVMRLVDQGKLDVDRPLREILPDVEIENPWDAVAPVTLAHCLEHTAGFDDVRFNEIYTDDEHLSAADALALNPRSRRVRWRPGTRHSYSNVGYTVAARAIEVASGEPFDTYLRREILAPIGIRDADFGRTGVLGDRLATGYFPDQQPVPFLRFAHRPSAALLASAGDLGKLVRFWIVHGEGYPPVVSRAGLARIERSGTLPYPHLDGDYGFANYGDVQHPVIGRGHDGGMPGFHSSFRYFSDLGVGYAFLLNAGYSFRGYYEVRALLFAYLTKGRAFPPPAEATPTERPGAGYYALGNPRAEILGFIDQLREGWQVTDHDDHVEVAELAGMQYEHLIPTADGGYRFANEYGSTVQFIADPDGKPIMLMGFAYGEEASAWTARMRYAAVGVTMLLLRLAPWWAAVVLAIGALRRRRVVPGSLAVSTAIAGLCCVAMPHLLDHAFFSGVIGTINPVTVALCGITIVYAVAAAATLIGSIRALRRPDRPAVVALLFPLACGLAFCGLAVWLGANHWIGLRTWAW